MEVGLPVEDTGGVPTRFRSIYSSGLLCFEMMGRRFFPEMGIYLTILSFFRLWGAPRRLAGANCLVSGSPGDRAVQLQLSLGWL